MIALLIKAMLLGLLIFLGAAAYMKVGAKVG